MVFRYGAITFFDVSPIEETAFLTQLGSRIQRPLDSTILEEIELSLAENVHEIIEAGAIFVQDFSMPSLQVVAEVLSRSVVLERFEGRVGSAFETLHPMAAGLGSGRLTRINYRNLLRRLGDVLLDQQEMVGRIAITDKPDVLWDHPELERLYARLNDEFEIIDRFEAVESKLNLIGRTIQTSIDLVQSRRSLRVEWYIVLLIIAEIGLTLYDLFIRHA